MDAASMLQSITEPPLVLTNSPTNFVGQALAPPLPLFNPQIGTLVDVRVAATSTLRSTIQAQNLSPTSGAAITASVSGQTELDFNGPNSPVSPIRSSLAQTVGPVQVDPYTPGSPINFMPPSGVSFDGVQNPAPTATNTQAIELSDPASLAFFTAAGRRATVPVTMSASAMADASAPNGNLTSVVRTLASAVVTVIYDYTPPCPKPTGVVRFGVHRQQTQLVVSFNGPANPTDAQNPANYTLTTSPGAVPIRIASATYNSQNNTVTLIPAQRINVHFHYQLAVNFPCYNGTPATIEFGGKQSLGGFTGDHHKTFFPVVNGHLVR
jgi:hypothetical protein